MTDMEYNLYIENYLKNDKTKSAIMLTAPWGMGKSYYVQNCLIPYLEQSQDKKCIVVSLYGLNDIKEISKAIYLEMRAKAISTQNEKIEAGKIVGKTILKGVLSKVGIDLSIDEQDLEKLYSSIDLTNKLVILEDLERSGISIKQVLGYVNNLVDQDGAKVLLVANENEIKRFETISSNENPGKSTTKWVYTDETEEYLKIKEKTVSDTILYLCNFEDAIENIFKLYAGSKIDLLLEQKDKNGKPAIVSKIYSVMSDIGYYNLRSFIFACQKTVDIFYNYTDYLTTAFLESVFLGNVAFALKLKNNDDLRWNEKISANELGTSKYPLYKFCYEYIKYQQLNLEEIRSSQEDFVERTRYEKKQRETNTALSILYDFPKQTEDILSLAVETVRDELKTGETIPLIQYGKVANYLIAVKKLLHKPEIIDECKVIMLENIKSDTQKDDKVLERLRFHDCFSLWEEEQKLEYNDFIEKMCSVFHENFFSYLEDENYITYLEKITEVMCDRENNIRQSKKFLDNINIDNLLKGLKNATSEQVSDFRMGINNVYGIANIRGFLPNDKELLIQIQAGVQTLLESDKGADKIVRLQYSWLIYNLEKAIGNY